MKVSYFRCIALYNWDIGFNVFPLDWELLNALVSLDVNGYSDTCTT